MATSMAEELAEIEKKIRGLCDTFLERENGRPYLLSRLGADLGEDARRLKLLSGRSLARFIAERLSEDYSIVLGGQHHNVQALVRANGSESSPSQVVVGDHSQPETQIEKGPRYHYRFWAAFSVPLKSEKRFVSLRDFYFTDSEPSVGEYTEIEEKYIAPEQLENRDEWIRQSVESWIAEHNLPRERFLARADGPTPGRSTGHSLLEAVIQALDKRQLNSVALPLDVVAELLRKRV